MANCQKAHQLTLVHEGGYVDDPDDRKTYKGISRRFHGDWPGWAIVDELKGTADFPSCLYRHEGLNQKVADFFKKEYWDSFWGDRIPDQQIANELFDTSVNLGIKRAVTFLQKGLNVLNRNELLYDDLHEDGKFGDKTLTALKTYLQRDNPSELMKVSNILQGMHYIEYMRSSPTQEKYARGWLARV